MDFYAVLDEVIELVREVAAGCPTAHSGNIQP